MLIFPSSPQQCLRFVNLFFQGCLAFGRWEDLPTGLNMLVLLLPMLRLLEAGGTTCETTSLPIKIPTKADAAAAACFGAGAGHKGIGWRDV